MLAKRWINFAAVVALSVALSPSALLCAKERSGYLPPYQITVKLLYDGEKVESKGGIELPPYPPELREAGVIGAVELDFDVDGSGALSNITYKRATSALFVRALRKVLSAWRLEFDRETERLVERQGKVRLLCHCEFNCCVGEKVTYKTYPVQPDGLGLAW